MAGVILYGAGEHARKIFGEKSEVIEKIEVSLLEDVLCFVDADETKHGKIHMGYPVISIDEAMEKYPNARYYLTVRTDLKLRYEICCFLRSKGIKKDNIINRVRITCPYLERFIVCGYHECAFDGLAGEDCGRHSLKSCCSDYGKNTVEYIPINGDLQEAFDKFIELRNNTLERLDDNIETKCDGCSQLIYTQDKKSEEFSYLIYNEMGRCNCKCIYCNYDERLGRNVDNDVNFIELFENVKKFGFNENEGVVELCNGEISIHPKKNHIYDVLKDYKIMFLTNGIIYDEEMQRRMDEGTCIINVSLDCGTSESYKKIKGVDAFQRVVNNLSKYCQKKNGIMIIKYILLPGINDNYCDIKEFVELGKKLGVDQIHIAHDLSKTFEEYNNEQIKKMLEYFIVLLTENSIPYEIYSKNVLEKLL